MTALLHSATNVQLGALVRMPGDSEVQVSKVARWTSPGSTSSGLINLDTEANGYDGMLPVAVQRTLAHWYIAKFVLTGNEMESIESLCSTRRVTATFATSAVVLSSASRLAQDD